MASIDHDQMRFMTKVARMYHEEGKRQQVIADELHITQSKVSRMLRRAVRDGIVQTVVNVPAGVHTDLEAKLEHAYGLRQALVVDGGGSPADLRQALGSATAAHMATTLAPSDVVGFSSWSSTLHAAIDAFPRHTNVTVKSVVQVVGGTGVSAVQEQANSVLARFARMTDAEAVYFPAPAIMESQAAVESLLSDRSLGSIADAWQQMTVIYFGIATLEPSAFFRQSGFAPTPEKLGELASLGVVGDICLKYFDAHGSIVDCDLNGRVAGVSVDLLQNIDRRVAVAGGLRKISAIRAALEGNWVNTLVTDVETATLLLSN